MWEIRCDADLVAMTEGKVVPGDVVELVGQYYFELKEATYFDGGEDFELEGGYIVVINPKEDDWRSILEVKQPIWLEYVDLIGLPSGTQVFRAVRMLDDELLMTYFLQAGVNEEADEWLKEYM